MSTLRAAGRPTIDDLCSTKQARAMAGGVTRQTFLNWRELPTFPLPAGDIDGFEVWDITELADWFGRNVDTEKGQLMRHATRHAPR